MMMKKIIQGGMGIYVSNFTLAHAVSTAGDQSLGTVSCTAAERIVPHLLQLGDVGGHIRRAFEHFEFPEIAESILKKYFIEGGKPTDQIFKRVPAFSMNSRADLIALTIASSFALIWLAKEGHTNPVSVNYLEKLQIPHVYHLTGAMLAGVDCVTMGAGITLQIPGILDALATGENPSYRISIEGGNSQTISFDPKKFLGEKFPKEMKRPNFLPIVSTDVLASLMCAKLPNGSIDGFVVELPTAGGHNAPPRLKGIFDKIGQPVYGSKDEVNFKKLQDLGIPFWIGGSYASPEGLTHAQSLGATGIQVGSIFALCEDSGFVQHLRVDLRRRGYRGELVIHTDPQASPTGFPFKVAQLDGTLSDQTLYEQRIRICDRSALLVPYQQSDGKVGFRCSSELVKDYLHKGGKLEDTLNARCLCNGLFSAVGLGNQIELPIITMGDDMSFLRKLMEHENDSYTAVDVVKYLLGET